MQSITSKEFMEKINSGKLKSSGHIFGKVKKSDSPSEVSFAFKAEKLEWIRIPSGMINHVHVIKTFTMDGEDVALVKIKLNEPENKEAKVLYDLLSVLGEKMMKWHMKKMMMWGMGSEMKKDNHGCEHHHCGCHHGMGMHG